MNYLNISDESIQVSTQLVKLLQNNGKAQRVLLIFEAQ